MEKGLKSLLKAQRKQQVNLYITGAVLAIAAVLISMGNFQEKSSPGIYVFFKFSISLGFLYTAFYLFRQAKINARAFKPVKSTGDKSRITLTPLNKIIGKAESGFTSLSGVYLEIHTGFKKMQLIIDEKDIEDIVSYFRNLTGEVTIENCLYSTAHKAA